jgi:Tol biopolymer transport system component
VGHRGRTVWLPWALAAAAMVAALAAWYRPGPIARGAAVVRFAQPPPAGGAFYEDVENSGLSVSPDGSQIAFSAGDASGPRRVWLRPIGALEASAVAGTDGAMSMFWSPDGRSLAYFTESKLRRVDLPGGTPVSICDVRAGIGFAGTWGADGQILFSSIEGEAIFKVAASGGVPTAFLKPDPDRGETRVNWPLFLPDGRRFLYLDRTRDGSGRLKLAEPGRPARDVMPLQSNVGYVEPGYLVFAQEGSLVGQRFDLAAGQVVGAPFSIATAVNYFFSTSSANFAASPSGTLVFQSHEDDRRLVWFDRSGREVATVGNSGQIKSPRLSPDERWVAFDRLLAGAYDVWETDLARGAETRLTFGVSSEGIGAWAPDGKSLYFNADRGAPPEIFRKNLVTASEERVLPSSGTMQRPLDVSPDGKTLLYTQRSAGGDHIWSVPLDGSRPPALAVDTPFEQEGARFSRDGRYFSFSSAPSGRTEVFVSPFPPTGEKILVSPNGGWEARWSVDGRELIYLSEAGRPMSVPIQTKPSLLVGTPVPLFAADAGRHWADFDVSASGRLLAVVVDSRSAGQPLTVVLHWTAGLDR